MYIVTIVFCLHKMVHTDNIYNVCIYIWVQKQLCKIYARNKDTVENIVIMGLTDMVCLAMREIFKRMLEFPWKQEEFEDTKGIMRVRKSNKLCNNK